MANILRTDETDPLCDVNVPKATESNKGLTLFATSIFLVGQMAGSGVLALPKAIVNSGWIGFVLIILCCIISGYTGVRLGNCWIILQERWPEYREHIRYPYPAIGEKALGRYGRVLVSACNNFTLFGVGTVFLLLAAQNIQAVLVPLHTKISFCYWLFLIGGCLVPFMWLGSPKEFWFVGLIAMIATLLACIIIVISALVNPYEQYVHDPPITFETFSRAFGTILFAFGGHSAFPTIQHDMKEPKQFSWSVSIAYAIILAMYIPVCATGYVVFGGNVKDNILISLVQGPISYAVTILITLHLLFGFIIVINPLCQDVEEFFKTPKKFGWKRAVIRSCIMILVLLVAETIPRFGTILNLVGGSTITILAFVFPPLFYIKLCKMKHSDWVQRDISLHELVFCWEIIIIGIVGGIASTYSTILDLMLPSDDSKPCFLQF